MLYIFLIVCLIGVLLYFARQFFAGGRCYSDAKLDGKTVIITGGNTGIGKETAKDLAGRGAKVIIACRNVEKGESVRQFIKNTTGSQNVEVQKLDLASLSSVRDFVKEFQAREQSLDILINNAGVMFCPQWETEDGFDLQFGTNHLGHFLLTNLLMDLLKRSSAARIINVSSIGHFFCKHLDLDDLNFKRRPYSATMVYFQSKLANIMFTKELARRLKGTTVTAYALHPGAVNTELMRHMSETWWFSEFLLKLVAPINYIAYKTPEEGAQTSIYCAVTPGIEKESGSYFSDCTKKKSSDLSYDDDLARKLWDVSCEMVGLE
ncbi:retinol dehydrogenase 11-like [Anneissia japonica]|uniref:retinol dehydrogenase 11-like n=1 Tax=Anneissia japonica TaxID=1529436 RepID=UPI001425B6E9|nr:retinol dehydrogenase 11-like [Anneissia japonica]